MRALLSETKCSTLCLCLEDPDVYYLTGICASEGIVCSLCEVIGWAEVFLWGAVSMTSIFALCVV